MNYYNDPNNVKDYIKMCEGYDGSNIYDALAEQLPSNSTLLELGSGAGLDIEYLKSNYAVTGSDLSDEFLKVCKKKYPDIPFLKIDALNLDLKSKFNCIYSNKVLHHLTEDELKLSLKQQAESLYENGLIAHSFWLGEENMIMNELLFTYYREENLLDIISNSFTVLTTLKYEEFKPNDSMFVIARLKDN